MRSFVRLLSPLTLVGATLLSACAGAAAGPTSTATRVPSATPTRTPTPAPTVTPTPETDLRIAEMADGSSVLFDITAGYQLNVPRDWITKPLSAADLESALSTFQDDPDIQTLVETFSASQAEPRLLAYPRPDGGSVQPIALTVAFQPDSGETPMDLLVLVTAATIALAVPDAQITSTGVQVNTQGVELGLMEVTYQINSGPVGGRIVTLRAAAFRSGTFLVLVNLIWDGNLAGTANQVWPGITNSIRLDPQ
ncbi:MAG: hypothetical protein WD040_04200 [Anaerolineales bacterium]